MLSRIITSHCLRNLFSQTHDIGLTFTLLACTMIYTRTSHPLLELRCSDALPTLLTRISTRLLEIGVQFTRETRPQLWSCIDHCQISQPDPALTPPCTYKMAVPEAVNRPLLRSLNLYRNATWDDPSATCKEFPPVALAAPGFTYPWLGALIMMSSVPIMIVPTATSGAVI